MKTNEIIQGCKQKHKKAQHALVRTYAPVLMAICKRYTKDATLAQDALQETFVNVFKYIHSYQDRGSFEGWLKKIAVNCSLTFVKKMKPLYASGEVTDRDLLNMEIPDIYSQLGVEDIMRLMEKLSPSMYTIFNLSVIEGYNHGEIGKMLDISERTSRATLSRARARLVVLIQEESKDEQSRIKSIV